MRLDFATGGSSYPPATSTRHAGGALAARLPGPRRPAAPERRQPAFPAKVEP